ncbi:MAG: hypothetical protein Ct9H300mP28_34210 [Pseudomonadota bacterium]|nr:MAG: hypothetical protein Ct9H300mP28_34210 [Pseudomonadota bacterium]
MLESLLYHFCVFFRITEGKFRWIEAVHKNKLIVVRKRVKSVSPANRIALAGGAKNGLIMKPGPNYWNASKNSISFHAEPGLKHPFPSGRSEGIHH